MLTSGSAFRVGAVLLLVCSARAAATQSDISDEEPLTPQSDWNEDFYSEDWPPQDTSQFRDPLRDVTSDDNLEPYQDYESPYDEETFFGMDEDGIWEDSNFEGPSDYETGNEEADELDNFFWTDHLDKFGGMKVKEYAHAAATTWDVAGEEGAPSPVSPDVPQHLRAALERVIDGLRSSEFHSHFWPVEVHLTVENKGLDLERGDGLVASEQLAKERQETGYPHLHLVASEDVPAQEVFMAVPESLAVSVESIKAGKNDFHIPASALEADDSLILAAWLLQERAKGSASKWAAFLALLPEKVPLPMLWNEEQLRVLDFAPAAQEVMALKWRVESWYRECDPEFIAFATIEQYKGALSVVWSQGVLASQEPEADSSGEDDWASVGPPLIRFLVPLGNLVPRKADGDASWQLHIDDEREVLTLVAESDISEGTAITALDDPEDATYFLLYRGVMPQEVPQDEFVVFGPSSQLVEYFANNFVKADSASHLLGIRKGVSLEETRRLFVSKALEATQQVVRVISTVDSDDEVSTYSFGSRGYIEPKLWAAYAVCTFFMNRLDHISTATINVAVLARLAGDLSDSRLQQTCSRLYSHAKILFPSTPLNQLRDAAESLEESASYIKQLALVWIHGFRTSYVEDQQILNESKQCSCVRAPSGKGRLSTCPASCAGKSLSDESELAMKFRMNRKKLLLDVVEHVTSICHV